MALLTEILSVARDAESGNFDPNEATDLPLHVRQCGRRYRALDRKLTAVVYLVLLAIALHISGGVPMLMKMLASQ